MKKKAIIMTAIICSFICTSCNRTSVADLHETESTAMADTGSNNVQTMQSNVKNSDQILYGKKGESYLAGDISLNIENVVFTDTLEDLNKLLNETDAESFTHYLCDVIDESGYVFSGKKLKDSDRIMALIQMHIKNNSTTSKKECLNPNFYIKNGDSFVNVFGELRAYNKYPDQSKDLKDALYYTFQPGEEIDTVLCVMMSKSVEEKNSIYLNTGYLTGDNSTNKLQVGSYMIPVNEE